MVQVSLLRVVFKVLLFAYRKPGLTPTEFRDYLEGKHMMLLKQLFGTLFPTSHVRRYIHRTEAESGDAPPATVLVGSQADFEYDAISELTFENEDAFKGFFTKYQSKEVAAAIQQDEEHFLDSGRMRAVVLGEVHETTK
ncbi:FtsJ-like methyltransferase [Purpureocillium lavendulum]|uniref:FtsJ-like methyltransferase n=1 Tax=Purpureocillium lavendulum TaxID=1247861 RepID=A0AB34FYT4_9HYPO|nr:FtsJ-like methyltransferase [Purpureocillium lavendulum]